MINAEATHSESGQKTLVSPSAQPRKLRHRVLKGGKLVLNNGASLIDCVVRDFNEVGARVRLTQPSILPEKLDLVINLDRSHYTARVCWIKGCDAGLELTKNARPYMRRI